MPSGQDIPQSSTFVIRTPDYAHVMPGRAVASESASFDTSDRRHRAANASLLFPLPDPLLFSFVLDLRHAWHTCLYLILIAWPRVREHYSTIFPFIPLVCPPPVLRLRLSRISPPRPIVKWLTRSPLTHTLTLTHTLPLLPAVARLTTANPPPRNHTVFYSFRFELSRRPSVCDSLT